MAYQTGTVSSASDLASTIRTFALANGWASGGLSEVVTKGGCHVRISSPSESEVKIEGARNGSFTAPDICPRYSRINLTAWPSMATYHLVAFNNPDTIWCTIVFAVTDHMHLGFGSLQKYGTWSGGMWFHASHTQLSGSKDGGLMSLIDGGAAPFGTGTSATEAGLFWSPRMDESLGGGYVENAASSLLCELRGRIWEPPLSTTGVQMHGPTVFGPTHKYNPNAFNDQTVLTPFQLYLQNTDGHYMAIGHVGHVRFVKLTNYNPGDVIEIGPDRWKLFPWHRKDVNNPDGKSPSGANFNWSTGVLGVAVRYDGA